MDLVKFFKSISDETRLRIVAILYNGAFSVQEIMYILNMGQSRISRHLKILTEASVTQYKRKGSRVYYRLNEDISPAVRSVFEWIGNSRMHVELEPLLQTVLEERRKKSLVFFDREGERWHRVRNRFIDVFRLYPEITLNIGNILKNREMISVDLGCGAGEILSIMTSYSNHVIGVDNSGEMLKAASRYLESKERKRAFVDLRLGNLEHLPLKDEEADFVVASLVIHHLAQPSVFFPELYRVLKPEGHALIAELCEHDNEKAGSMMADLWHGFPPHDLCAWLTSSGFEIVKQTLHESEEPFLPFMLILARKKKGEGS